MLFSSIEHYARSGFRPRVCIIGTGPAGMSLALRLSERKVPCLLIEAGDFQYSAASQEFYRGTTVGDPYPDLHETRLRQFGGSSGHWSGWVYPLDKFDFETRSYIPHSGWPISVGDLAPYAAAADALLQVKTRQPDRPMTRDMDYIQYRFSPPVRFGTQYRELVEQSPTIGLLVNAPVLELVPGRERIESVRVGQASNTAIDLRVDQVCVCTGGIENSRLLLWSNAQHAGRVVPNAAALGRYWMDHPVQELGDVIATKGYEARFEAPTSEKWFFSTSDEAESTYRVGGAHLWMNAHQPELSFAKELLHSALCIAPEWANRSLKRYGKEYHCGALVQAEFEQFPVSENRVELDHRSDSFGVPLSRLHWKMGESERRTAIVAAKLLGAALVKHDIGRLRIRNYLIDGGAWPNDGQLVGRHHMGGTRMASTPEEGVVDRNCKVFGVDNLYIGGSSVFTTGGHANPTYTIVQLALRLGEHLAAKLAAG